MPILTKRQQRAQSFHAGRIVAQEAGYTSRHVLGAAPTSQVSRLTLSGTSASEVTVTAELGGDSRTVSVTFAGSVDATNNDALLAALQADSLFAGFFGDISEPSTTTIDLTALRALEPIVTVTGTGISVSTPTAAADSFKALYGRVYPIGVRTTDHALGADQIAARTALAGPTATLTCTFNDAGDDYDIVATLQNPEGRNVSVVETDDVGADLPAMLLAVKATLEATVPGSTATVSSPDVEWALPVGWRISLLNTSADNSSDLTNVIDDAAGSALPVEVGVAKNPMNDEFADFEGTYQTGRLVSEGVTLVTGGASVSVPIESGTTPTDQDAVWVETEAGGDYGLCYDTPSPSRYLLSAVLGGGRFAGDHATVIATVRL